MIDAALSGATMATTSRSFTAAGSPVPARQTAIQSMSERCLSFLLIGPFPAAETC